MVILDGEAVHTIKKEFNLISIGSARVDSNPVFISIVKHFCIRRCFAFAKRDRDRVRENKQSLQFGCQPRHFSFVC